MSKFFFDTANEDQIREVWDSLSKHVSPDQVAGVTTNPSALNKIGVTTLSGLEDTIPQLCSLITEMREGEPGGEVYVQLPFSQTQPNYIIFQWAKYIAQLTDGVTSVGLKIPHYTYVLSLVEDLTKCGVDINVTGISDWATLIKAFAYPVSYASLITGRMDEVGINSILHLKFAQAVRRASNQNIIAGSMRTIQGLQQAWSSGAIPTIGTRVWNQLKDNWAIFPSLCEGEVVLDMNAFDCVAPGHSPIITAKNVNLSVDFFKQMDEFGGEMYKEFVSKISLLSQEEK